MRPVAEFRAHQRRRFLSVLAVLALVGVTAAAAQTVPASAYATATSVRYVPEIQAYGTVAPESLVQVNAPEAGILTGFSVLPGTPVRAGETLARLTGPTVSAQLAQRESDLRGANQQLAAARTALAVVRRQLSEHLATNAQVAQDEGALAQARAAAANARSALAAVRAVATITAPTAGTVQALNAADGQLVPAGQSVVTLRPSGRLWLQAEFYGANVSRLHVGMRGEYTPASGGASVAVKVIAISGVVKPDGGETVSLVPVAATRQSIYWRDGAYGTVAVHEPAQTRAAVPTNALILNQTHWYVLVRTPKGPKPQEVTPGPARGWTTVIERGLKPGQQVVARNAYLIYNRGIASSYTPPD